jgi:peptidoglycan/xylan/chitin deacetylase (PgdA/CDA1 family)
MQSLCGALALCVSLVSPQAPAHPHVFAVPVFAYHRIDNVVPKDRIGSELTLRPAQLESELRALQARGIRAVTASELIDRLAHHEPVDHLAVLTFDDGYADAATEALPLLEKYGAKATFYVILHTIGTPNHLTWSDIRAMMHAGMEIGAHGTDHLDLSRMSKNEQTWQVTHVLDGIARYTGVRPRTYAYPSGRYNPATLAVMHAAGIEAAFTMKYGFVRSLQEPYRMPRVRINRTTAAATFEAAVDGK